MCSVFTTTVPKFSWVVVSILCPVTNVFPLQGYIICSITGIMLYMAWSEAQHNLACFVKSVQRFQIFSKKLKRTDTQQWSLTIYTFIACSAENSRKIRRQFFKSIVNDNVRKEWTFFFAIGI